MTNKQRALHPHILRLLDALKPYRIHESVEESAWGLEEDTLTRNTYDLLRLEGLFDGMRIGDVVSEEEHSRIKQLISEAFVFEGEDV